MGEVMDQPLVSVIMNCFNGEQYLQEAIDSIYAQDYSHWEIVFYDNASTDRSAEIARRCDKRLCYFRSNATIPLGAARNEAIARAHGELVAFLDTDDRWLPAKLSTQVDVFLQHADVDFVYSNFYFLPSPGDHRYLGYSKPQPHGRVFRSFLRHYPVNLQTVMLRLSALERLSTLFDPSLNMSEEYDLFMRLLHSSNAHYVDAPLAVYRIHSGMASIKFADKYPEEYRYILNKLRDLEPFFDRTYAAELRYLGAKIGYWQAVAEMQKDNALKARQALGPHKWVSPLFFAIYCATYLPVVFWRKLHELRFTISDIMKKLCW
ncbi:MAG: glycosyltransferase [Gammaproteobacteria bacterium]|nr:glycosyltransferase [Gammaproteobacteria bacterium]